MLVNKDFSLSLSLSTHTPIWYTLLTEPSFPLHSTSAESCQSPAFFFPPPILSWLFRCIASSRAEVTNRLGSLYESSVKCGKGIVSIRGSSFFADFLASFTSRERSGGSLHFKEGKGREKEIQNEKATLALIAATFGLFVRLFLPSIGKWKDRKEKKRGLAFKMCCRGEININI